MITINIDPVLFSFGPFSVRWYGLMYAVGILVALWVTLPYARSKGITAEHVEKALWWAVPAGLVGARLYFVVQQPLAQYLADPWRILAFWEGGMAFYGAIFAVLVVMVLMARRSRISVWRWLDAMAIFGVVGQFFGRIGNIINGDVLGYQTTLPWGFVYVHPNSFAPRHDVAYQPAAVYELIINVIIFTILWRLREKVRPGILFFTWIFSYSVSQILVFFVRDNEIVAFGLKQAQLTAILVIVGAAILFVWYRRTGQAERAGLSSPVGPEVKEGKEAEK